MNSLQTATTFTSDKNRLTKLESKNSGNSGGVIDDTNLKRKVGRPFKGQVEEFTREPHVPERRSILRGFKKFYSKKEFEDIVGVLEGRVTPQSLGQGAGVTYYDITSGIYDSLQGDDLIEV